MTHPLTASHFKAQATRSGETSHRREKPELLFGRIGIAAVAAALAATQLGEAERRVAHPGHFYDSYD